MSSEDQLLEQATQKHRSGDLAGAESLYLALLSSRPDDTVATFRLGLLNLQSGRLEEALRLLERAVDREPTNLRYVSGLGQVLIALQCWELAAASFRRILATDPASAEASFSLGVASQALGALDDAISAYRAAIKSQPDLPDAHNNLGICLQLSGDLAAAEASYRRALESRPDYAGAMANLAAVLRKTGRAADAIVLLQTAVVLEPATGSHLVGLGAALCEQRDFAAAEHALRNAIALGDSSAEVTFNLGNVLLAIGRPSEAIDAYRRSLIINSRNADTLVNLGNAHRALGELVVALDAYTQSLEFAPGSLAAINNAGCVLRSLGRSEEAERMLRRGLSLDPGHALLLGNLGTVLKDGGLVDEAIECFRASLAANPSDAATHSNLAYTLSFVDADGEETLAECLRWARRFETPLLGAHPVHLNDRVPERRLRIGYVSPDFRDHCQALFMVPLLTHHNRSAVEVFCYSSVERPDAYSERMAGLVDTWRDVRLLDDEQLSQRIRADRIDVLVDLTMHMANSRLLVFARKPAPVQVAWLAYPGTTGLAAMDYRFSDPWLEGAGVTSRYSEATIALADSFWCYDPLAVEPSAGPLPARKNGYVTFGCLNNPCKLTDRTLDLWAGVLTALPTSRLLLMAPAGNRQATLVSRLGARGVRAERVGFVPFRPRAEYLRTYCRIDIGLDTLPYNGHTTTLDALWMGVPVLTQTGSTCVGRGGLSQLHNLGLNELTTRTDSEFISRAIALASELDGLESLRRSLRDRLGVSPLMDAPRFAAAIEAAYRGIWRDYCAKPVP